VKLLRVGNEVVEGRILEVSGRHILRRLATGSSEGASFSTRSHIGWGGGGGGG